MGSVTGSAVRTASLLLCALVAGGCAWHSAGAEHYLGPVWFRYSSGDDAHVRQTRRFGLLFEGGRQWSLGVGSATRVAASPADVGGATHTEHWDRKAWFGATKPETWHFSPFYVSARNLSTPVFFIRSLFGVQAGFGSELRSLTLGWARRSEIRPPPDSLYRFRYDSSRPLDMHFKIWRYEPGEPAPVQLILK